MYKRKDGLFQEALTINGKRRFFYGKTKADVLRKINDFKEKEENGLLFSEVAEAWYESKAKEIRPSTLNCYNSAYKSAVAYFGKELIKDIKPQDIERYIYEKAQLQYAKYTVRNYLSMVSQIYDFAIRNNYTQYNPCATISVPRNLKSRKRELPDESAIQLVRDNVDAPFGLFPYFLMLTGCRKGEALAVKYSDIDFDKKLIRINKSLTWIPQLAINETKTSSGNRTVILLDALADKIPKRKSGFLFGNKQPFTQYDFDASWKKYKDATGIDITPHQLRHLYATILFECGIDEVIAKELMGHSNISVTRNIYTHIRERKLSEVSLVLNNYMSKTSSDVKV